jgi:hypothetical protein
MRGLEWLRCVELDECPAEFELHRLLYHAHARLLPDHEETIRNWAKCTSLTNATGETWTFVFSMLL